jgi:hypothetical protein
MGLGNVRYARLQRTRLSSHPGQLLVFRRPASLRAHSILPTILALSQILLIQEAIYEQIVIDAKIWRLTRHAGSGSPMSAVILRCYDFPARIPGHLFVSLPGSTLPSSVRVSQLALALPEERRVPSGPGSMFNRRPNCQLALAWA